MTQPNLNDDYLSWCLARPGVSRELVSDGHRTHYLEWTGPPHAPCLLLVHGFIGHAHWWDFVAPALAENARVIAMDLAGMGDSAHHDAYTYAGFVADIAGVIRTIGSSRLTIIGHSFGGRCAILTAYTHPELFERLIVVDSRVRFPDEEPPRAFDLKGRGKKRYPDLASAKERFRLEPEEPGTPARILDHIATDSLKRDGDAWVWKFDPAVTVPIAPPATTDAQALPQLRIPMDFVCGEHSVVAPIEHARRVVASARNSRGPIVIPAAGHHVIISQSLALVSALRALLAMPSSSTDRSA